MIRVLVGVLGGVLIVMMLSEIFVSFLLPRRVKRDPKLVRSVFAFGWRPWRRVARMLPAQAEDTMLGIYGPAGLLMNLVLWVAAMMLGYAALQWAGGSHLRATGPVTFGNDLFFSAATMASSGTAGLSAQDTFARTVQVIDAVSGLAVIAIVIGYLPSLYQAFSRREATVSQLDARAGSPPSPARLIARTTEHGGWPALNRYLSEWEGWVAELMETHLAYPVLGLLPLPARQPELAVGDVHDPRRLHLHDRGGPARDRGLGQLHLRDRTTRGRRPQLQLPRDARARPRWIACRRRTSRSCWRNSPRTACSPPSTRRRSRSGWPACARSTNLTINALAERLDLALPPWLATDSPTDNWRTTQWH